ncbi:Palmitoyltransferase [Aphelenchoides besseyi]|nr:Palmitoyltransferase [Aphelenchoides besseyi]KAI6231307.1 Palmitoyltransferase [Aphelenchoides besseyi]
MGFFCRSSRVYSGNNHFCGLQWCNRDICGIFCAIFTWFLMCYAQFCVCFVMMATWTAKPTLQFANFFIFQFFFLLSFISHFRTMTTDPGAVPKGNLTDDYLQRLERERTAGGPIYKCHKCASVKPERAHHCSVCDRCIRRMDHHCPWVNNCVGEKNQKTFVLFTLYIALMSIHVLIWTIAQFVFCVDEDFRGCSYFGAPTTTILLIFLLFESILFSIFTLVMLGTQLSAICADQTGIESLRKEVHAKGSGWKNLQVVFGGPISLRWFNPMAAPFLTEKAFEFSV